MRKLSAVLVVLIVVVCAVWFATRKADTAEASAPPEHQPPAVEDVTSPSALTTAAPRVEEAQRTDAQAPPPIALGVESATNLAEIRGRFVFEGGGPAAGVALKLTGFAGNQDLIRKYGVPANWKPLAAVSGDDGWFSMKFDPPRAYQFTLKGSFAGWCETLWRWSDIEPAAVVDLGDVELVLGGSVRGRIVDTKGRSLSKGWTVYGDGAMDLSMQSSKGGRRSISIRSPVDADRGEFLLEGLPPGLVHLKADSKIANWIEGPDVMVRAGEESRADIVYSGPDNDARIVVSPSSRPFHAFGGEPKDVVLLANGFETRHATRIPRSSQSWSFEDVPAGFYTVEIRDDRFLPWSKSGVQPGELVDARLKGSAAVRLEVVDDVTGTAIERYTLDVRFDRANFGPDTFRVFDEKVPPPVEGLLDGLIPFDQTMLVQAPGYALCEVPALGLAAGETRSLVARVSKGRSLLGIVIDAGTLAPVAGAKVTIEKVAQVDPEPKPAVMMRRSLELDSVPEQLTRADGRFVFDALPLGKYQVRASSADLLYVTQRIEIGAGSASDVIELALPASGSLVGRLLGPVGGSYEGLKIVLVPLPEKQDERGFMDFELMQALEQQPENVDSNGRFRVGPIPAGEARVEVRFPNARIPSGRSGWSSSGGTKVELGMVTIVSDEETESEFDIRAIFPGRVRVTLHARGASALGAFVMLARIDGFGTAGSIPLDGSGSGVSGPVQPGTYRFVTNAIDGSWFHVDPTPVVVQAGETSSTTVEVELISGVLRVLQSDNAKPAANAPIHFALADEPFGRLGANGQTDAEGNLKIALQLGRYRVTFGGEFPGMSSGDPVIMEWSATGPSPAEISLRPSPESK